MTTTSNLGITLVEQSQAQKEITINQALITLDALIGNTVADKDLATPPGSPVTGAVYIVAASATGAWAGKETCLAYFDQIWRFIVPQTGMFLWVKDESASYKFNGSAWVIVSSGGGGGGSGDMLQATYDPASITQQVVGISATQTLTNKTLTTPIIASISNTGTLTLPTSTDTLVGCATTDTLTNKTINGASNTLTVRLASDVSGTLPVANGGTGKTSVTANSVLLGNGTSALAEVAPGTSGNVLTSNGTAWVSSAPSGGGGGGGSSSFDCNARLTLTSNMPVTTSDVTGATSVYVTPYGGNKVALYDGTSAWTVLSFSQLTISLASGYSSGKPYDVFLYNNSGSVAAETLVWTNDTTRATALAFQDGIYVKSGATTRRYIGTFYTTSSMTTEDSLVKRYVWNAYNRIYRPMLCRESAGSWTYTSTTLRQANGNTANQLNFVRGLNEDAVNANLALMGGSGSGVDLATGMGLDTTTSINIGQGGGGTLNNATNQRFSSYTGAPDVGRHYIAWLEASSAIGTTTWYGNYTGGGGTTYSGLSGGMLA